MILKFKLASRVDLGKSTTQSAPVSTSAPHLNPDFSITKKKRQFVREHVE